MKKLFLAFVLTGIVPGGSAHATPIGVIDTDRFGYTGMIRQYATEADARAGANLIAERPIITSDGVNNRDLSVEIFNGYAGINPDYPDINNILGAYWYTTGDNLNGLPKDDPDGDRYYTGWGNLRGNSGMFMQIQDLDSSTDTSLDMAFQNFDGTYWTEFNLNMTGSGAFYTSDYAHPYDEGDLARCRIQEGTTLLSDPGTYLEYSLTLIASGLQGVENGNGWIEAFNHPESVSGNYSGLFKNHIVSETTIPNEYFWTFDLQLNMVNWAYEQGDEALNGNFKDSYFAATAIPEPATTALLALGGGLLLWNRRRRRG